MEISHDATIYLVLEDFGSLGQAYRETDPTQADRCQQSQPAGRQSYRCQVLFWNQ